MPRLQTIFRNSLFILSALIMTALNQGLSIAQEEVINKEKMPLKEITDSEQSDSKEMVVDPGYIYDPTGRTDPFKSFIAIQEEKLEEEKKKPKTYLETLELSQLDLVVIVIGPKGKWAMVKDSKDVGHVIKEGTLVGTNGGVVHQIREGEVVIREEYTDFRGRKQFREIIKSSPSE
jgi:type IV pilus assembly protein PilP